MRIRIPEKNLEFVDFSSEMRILILEKDPESAQITIGTVKT